MISSKRRHDPVVRKQDRARQIPAASSTTMAWLGVMSRYVMKGPVSRQQRNPEPLDPQSGSPVWD